MKYEYECWKCSEWHPTEITDFTKLAEMVELTGASIRLIDTKRVIIDGGAYV